MSLNLIIGPMYSGKTSELLSRYLRYKVAGKKCLLIKFENDNRYDQNKIVTHNLFKQDALNCNKLETYDNDVKDYDVILIDEIQFFPDANIFCDKWANEGKIVEASGLNGDFQRKPFDQISLLIPKSDKISHLVAVDKKDGNNAPFTCRLSDESEQKLIGGDQIYEAMNRRNFINNVSIKQQHLCI